MLVGIIGLAGMPPMNGFVSKWMVYRALMLEGYPLLFIASIIGTLGTILSVYKLIHNMFLGQLRLEHQQVREVPWSMAAPMMLLAARRSSAAERLRLSPPSNRFQLKETPAIQNSSWVRNSFSMYM